jgi:lipopolysaccharide assembly protein A
MRFVLLVFLLAFLAVVGLFAYQNQQEVTLVFFNWGVTASVSIVVGAVFVLGMLSGWTIVGLLRRSVARVIQPPRREYANQR